jgi:hypothetical protein
MSRLGKRLHDYIEDTQGRIQKKGTRPEWVDLIEVEDMLERLGIEQISAATGSEMRFACPFPGHTHGDANPSAYMNTGAMDKKKTSAWQCKGCGRSGASAISFIAELFNISRQEAARHLREEYAADYRSPKGGSIAIEFEERYSDYLASLGLPNDLPVIPWERYQELFSTPWQEIYDAEIWPKYARYIFERGFPPDVLEGWLIGYDTFSKRLTIPVCDPDGNLVGVKGRAWKKDEKIRYKVIGDLSVSARFPNPRTYYDFMAYEKSRAVFGIDRVAAQKEAGRVIWCEGELDAIALGMAGFIAVCTSGAVISEVQANILRDHIDELVLFGDYNKAGIDGMARAIVLLEDFMRVYVVDEHEDDPADMVKAGQIDELRQLIENAVPSHHLR